MPKDLAVDVSHPRWRSMGVQKSSATPGARLGPRFGLGLHGFFGFTSFRTAHFLGDLTKVWEGDLFGRDVSEC